MKIIFGYQNTKENEEDFALTPFLFGICMRGMEVNIYGIGICWGWWAVHISFGFGFPKHYPVFNTQSSLKKKGENA